MNRTTKLSAFFSLARALGVIAALFTAGAASANEPASPISGASYVGESVCLSCHQVENEHFGHTLHAKIFRQNPKNEIERQVCEACLRIPTIVTAHTDERDRCSVRASVVFRV